MLVECLSITAIAIYDIENIAIGVIIENDFIDFTIFLFENITESAKISIEIVANEE